MVIPSDCLFTYLTSVHSQIAVISLTVARECSSCQQKTSMFIDADARQRPTENNIKGFRVTASRKQNLMNAQIQVYEKCHLCLELGKMLADSISSN
jgi:hypothetical protein